MTDLSKNDLKLVALDEQDLSVISAHLQDCVLRICDMDFDRRAKQFACVVNRFDWMGADKSRWFARSYQRKRSGLRFDRVLSVRTQNIDMSAKNEVLSLLALSFSAGDAPGGRLSLLFSGGGVLELSVECIEAELRDLGAAWETHAKPVHRGKE